MCGVVGIVGRRPVNQIIYDALTVLQHRGQDAAGICTIDDEGYLRAHRGNGLVKDVFQHREMVDLAGEVGIGHIRYPTAGGSSADEAQPFYVNSPYGICLAHNGNLTNLAELSQALMRQDLRHLRTGSDSEALLNVLAQELVTRARPTIAPEDAFAAVRSVHKRCRGSYAAVALITGHGVLGFRDPHGLRPLVLGSRKTSEGSEYMMASESVALDICGFELERDVRPGEAVFIDMAGRLHAEDCTEQAVEHTPCIFEYVYFARPDSIIDGISVYRARMRMGEKLADKIARERPDHDIDCVIPVPDTSRTAALEVAQTLGVKYREGLVKNRYVGRTFIMPGQEIRKKSVRQKLNTIDLQFRDKTVLLVDDSIVRGTTSRQIIEMVREAGAKRVYFASAAPPVRHPNVYGIDMPTPHELIAHGRSNEEICKALGADWLVYQELEDLVDAVKWKTSPVQEFDTSCFSGEYVTGDITEEYLHWLHESRSDDAKIRRALGPTPTRSSAAAPGDGAGAAADTPALRGVGNG
ncbi:MAG: amidophosphoribosyltransferase [Pseudomonadota bacterium]